MDSERVGTVVVGGGQAGLAVGHHLARRGRACVILEAHDRVGDSWRHRWDSLRLFTPARYDALPGSRYPAHPWSFPSHADFADYLERYAAEEGLAVRTGVRVRRLSRDGDGYLVETGSGRLRCDDVVVATGHDAVPRVPSFAAGLAPEIAQCHAADYRRPTDLPDGDVLVVGAGNSGADLALELAAGRVTYLSGRHPGQIPWRVDRVWARPLDRLVFAAFRHVLTVRTPIGRRARPQVLAHSGPLIRVKTADLEAAGVRRVPRTVGVQDGRPLLEDGRVLDVAAVVWCTGFRPDDSWIDPDLWPADGEPAHDRGAVLEHPGLYVLGRVFQDSLASSMVHGVSRDAERVARHIAARHGQPSRRDVAGPA